MLKKGLGGDRGMHGYPPALRTRLQTIAKCRSDAFSLVGMMNKQPVEITRGFNIAKAD